MNNAINILAMLQQANSLQKRLNTRQKRNLLANLIELHVQAGYDISWVFGKPLSDFDYDEVKKGIEKFEKIVNNQ